MISNYFFDPKGVDRVSTSYNILILLLVFLYGLLMASFPMEGVVDRGSYLDYADYSIVVAGKYLNQGVLSFFTNEPLWLGINILLSQFFIPEETVRIVAGVPAFAVAYYVLRYNPKYFIFLLFLLFLPQVIKNHVSHLRQGVAIAFFIAGWFSSKNALRIFLIGLTPFIHASFFFIVFLFGINWITTKMKFAIDLKTIVYVIVGLAIGVSASVVASSLGARQVYYGDGAETSGLGFIFWTGILSLFFLEGKQFARRYAFVISILIFYLSTYFLFGATARVFESALILVMLTGLGLTKWRKQMFYFAFVLYFMMMYSSRIIQPYFGWIN